jgi:2-polyprenyl-6-methoxyphenol hydroxylase-like FAD-dependent oxidoreductase
MKILVVGAGIGGLAFAALARQRGTEVTLVERAPAFGEAGYMLALYPAGSRVLHGLGIYDAYVRKSAEFLTYAVHDGQGSLLHEFDLSGIGRRYGHIGQILRSDLLEILRGAAPDLPLHFGTSPVAIEQGKHRVRVSLSDGSVGDWDAVIGADGIHSETRRLIFGYESDTETGWGLWVWWMNRHDGDPHTVREFWGRGRFVGIYPTPGPIGAIAAAPRTLLNEHAVNADGARVRELFAEMNGPAADVMATFPERTEGLFYRNLNDFRSRAWVKDRVALLGDSACAFLPIAGVGASMALESAAVLADEISRANSRLLPDALALYAKRRQTRVEAAQDEARRLAAWLSTDSPALAWTRDHLMKIASPDTFASSIAKGLADPI